MPRKRLSESDKEVLSESRKLVNSLTARDLALLNPGHENVQLTQHREGHIPKRKRGGSLVDYSALEVWLDLKAELTRHNARLERVYTLYFYLKNLVNA